MFDRVLIANRGEICVRIVRALREMGVTSVAVYSDPDREALHARIADEAYHIGPASATESYLNVERLIEVAKRSGAGAVHPGYGFLAESAPFARAVEEAGLVWIGPHPAAIEAMGSKVESRRIMAKAGVPMVPGTEGSIASAKQVSLFGEEHGFPVAVKASAGGGGKGFAVAGDASEGENAFERASREGVAYFGDGAVYVEKYLPAPRHVEIQVVRDRKGNAVHLGERDCSIQRRHQKLVEEAPSPAVDPALRARLAESALAAVGSVPYEGAGTVEFLVDRDGRHFFIEMNTRLQVEHPVTEAITGLDLVEWQFRVAAGEPLPLTQDRVRFDGHAIEVRLCAEDAALGFMPASGTLARWQPPAGLRVEHALHSGMPIVPFYDS